MPTFNSGTFEVQKPESKQLRQVHRGGFSMAAELQRKVVVAVSTFIILLFAAGAEAAPIYVIKESDGTIRFTNRTPPPWVAAKVFTSNSGSFARYRVKGGYNAGSYNPYRLRSSVSAQRYESTISQASKVYQVEPALLKAVIHAESAFNPYAVSRKGAIGLMQLMPETARGLGVRPYDADENIHGGARHLARLIKKYEGNLVYALAAYNAGEEAVEKYRGVPPYSETQNYVRKVLALKNQYGPRG